MANYPGQGTMPCEHDGCRDREVEGLEYCLAHMPADLLDEAEDITGVRRCRGEGGQGECARTAIKATDPPACRWHSSRRGRKDANLRVIEGRVADAADKVAAEADLDNPPPLINPLQELLLAGARAGEWERVARRVMTSLGEQSWRYQTGKVGEQVRAELLLWERALDRQISVLEKLARLNIAQQLVGIRAETAAMVARALDEALRASGADLEGQHRARLALTRSLKVIDGGLAG